MHEFSRQFKAMNTEVAAAVVAPPTRRAEAKRALADVEALFAENEAAMSRFRPESELSRLNRSAGQPFQASPLLFRVIVDALAAARATDGLFDPTVLNALVAAGYDRSFELLSIGPELPNSVSGDKGSASLPESGTRALAADPSSPNSPSHPSWRDVRVEESDRRIVLPERVALDLGGIGKGWTVDRAAEMLRSFGGFAVDAGGDIYLAGTQADGAPWTVGVQDPRHPDRDLLVLPLRDRAVATSSVHRRRWIMEGREQHHLIDPRTALPAESGVVSATVVAGSVARAEVLAKVALLLGREAGAAFLKREPGVEWALVLADGEPVLSAGLRDARSPA